MDIKLIFLDSFESKYKDKTYLISRFLDPKSMTLLYGTDLNLSFVQYKVYDCTIEWNTKKGKFKVVKAS